MPSISSILDEIKHDFPHILFVEGGEFRWSSKDTTIFYVKTGNASLLLHELGHAQLEHKDFTRDINLLALECDAWQVAVEDLSERYRVSIDESEVQSALDTYRDWLHARSSCPRCHSIGIQAAQASYRCLACHAAWRVNDGRGCSLRRYLITKNTPHY